MDHKELLEGIYNSTLTEIENSNYSTTLPPQTQEQIKLLVSRSEANKGLLTVLITLLTHKIIDPSQDIRNHQTQIPNGFSGRTIDSNYVTPFMKSVKFPAMSESGWLTRSLEQPLPYNLDYPGKITPKCVKDAFLSIIDNVQNRGMSPKVILNYLFRLLIEQRDSMDIELAKPHSLSISSIIKLLEKHFTYKYNCQGGSRLPVLAVYAAYECMINEVDRYEDKVLCPLESHNSADTQSGRIGDIDINDKNGEAFEGIEIKHSIEITAQLVKDAYEKFKIHKTDRYYLLTTANMEASDWESIDEEIKRISNIHGCQVIVNGVYSSIKYYLRLLRDPSEFTDKYVELLKRDDTVKFQHKEAWNKIVNEGV